METVKIKLLRNKDGKAIGRFWSGVSNHKFCLNVNLLGETVLTLNDKTLRNKNEYILDHTPMIGKWEEYGYYREEIE